MKKFNHIYMLMVLSALLLIVCCMSIYSPLRFQQQQEEREAAVKHRLIQIRHAEELYRKSKGTYAGTFHELTVHGLLADSLQYVPYTDGKRFDLAVSMHLGESGRQVPLMECGALYSDYLQGLDENSVANLIEEANNTGRYPGLKIGDLTTPNDNAGNWE